MTSITRFAVPVLAVATLAVAALSPAGAASTSQHRIDPLDQHVVVHTRSATGQPLDSVFYGHWLGVKPPSPVLSLRGASNRTETTTFRAETPAPAVARPGGHGYCVTLSYRFSVGDTTALAKARYASSVVVRRHGDVVARSRFTGNYLAAHHTGGTTSGYTYGPVAVHKTMRFAHFTLRRHDHVTWQFSGTLANQINRFRSKQTIKPSC